MGESIVIFKGILQFIGIAFSVTTIVFLAKIFNGTKENPLEVYDNRFFNKSETQPTEDNNPDEKSARKVSNVKDKYCQCGDNIINNICTEEQIIEGCYDILKNNENRSLRLLDDSNCDNMKTDIINQGFSKVFKLNYGTVHKMALGIIVVLSALGFSVLISLITQIGVIICGEKAALIIAPFLLCIICVGLFAGLTNFILFMIMLVKYYKGKTTGEFLDFYEDCLDEQGKSNLEETYDKLHDMNKYMTVFVALNFIQLGLNLLESCLNYFTKEKNRSY